jgi:tetratricopeptide (TPR) repeat protein
MKSRLLSRLDDAIAAARDPIQGACLGAERAALLARMGRFDEAAGEIGALRARAAGAPSPALAVWLCLADGMVEHFRHGSPAARDRIQRAYALAAAARLRPLIALSAAWLAHTDYACGDRTGLARHVAEALQEAQPDHHAARARASLVAAQGYHWAGRADRAQAWYRRAHEHATAEGDDTTIGALLKHRAWISGDQARMASIFGAEPLAVDDAALRNAQLGAESAEHFERHAGHAACSSPRRCLRVQLLVAQARYGEALGALQQELAASADEGEGGEQPSLHADLAWCLSHLGRADEALTHARRADAWLLKGGEAQVGGDAQASAAVHGRLRQAYTALGCADKAAVHAERAQVQLDAWRSEQARLAALLDSALRQVTDTPRVAARV